MTISDESVMLVILYRTIREQIELKTSPICEGFSILLREGQ